MASFLDSAGVTRLVTKLKTIFAVKATTLSGYGITNGVSSVSVTGTGQAVSAASISGHTLTLTKGASLPTVRHERPTSASIQVSNFTSSEELILDLTAVSYSAGAKFWINFLHTDITRGYGLYRGCVITGAQTCTVSFGGITSIKGAVTLQAASVYHFTLCTNGRSGQYMAKGYVQWQRISAS